jgi:hypothetical protein
LNTSRVGCAGLSCGWHGFVRAFRGAARSFPCDSGRGRYPEASTREPAKGEVRGHFAALRMQVTMQTELRCIG